MDEARVTATEAQAEALGALVVRAMDPATAAVELARVRQRHHTRQTIYAAVGLALGLVGLMVLTQTSDRPPHMALADGTTVQALSDDLDVVVRETHAATRFELKAGRARFDVAPREVRPVRVVAGAVVVDVLGTRFDVHRAARAVTVEVHTGRVRVRSPEGQFMLVAGARSVYPVAPPSNTAMMPIAPASAAPASIAPQSGAPASSAAPSAAPASVAPQSSAPQSTAPAPERPSRRPEASVARSVGSDWQALARAGDYQGALAALPAKVDGADALFLAADVARRAGQTRLAMAHLGTIVAQHPESPKAPLAAFTRGRLATQPRQAARAFEQAFALAQQGPLAVDALARAALAWQAAGALDRAKAAARRALLRAPEGRRAAQLRGILAQ